MASNSEKLAIALELQRRKARRGFYDFARGAFFAMRGFHWVHNHHHQTVCDALMRVYRGECKRLIINIPPRYSKTELAVVMFIAWCLGQHPDCEFIHTSYSGTLAANNTANCRSLVQSDFYRRVFPEVTLSDSSAAKGDWRTTEGGVVYAQGSGGTITGFGAGKMRDGFGGAIIIDDPHKADEADSDVIRKGVIEWFGNTLESRGNGLNRSTPIILIMQRLHESDLAGYLLEGGNGEKWEHVSLPAIQADGTALWPLKHTIEQLQVMQRATPYVFAGQYMQLPAPLAGGEFKPDNIAVIDAIPAGTRKVRAWDLAGTEQDGDFTAGGGLGQMPDGRYVIFGMVHMQESPENVETAMKATASRDGTDVVIAIPQDPGQAGKSQIRSLTRLLAGYSVASKPVSGDKVTRARPLAAQINVGNVVMLRGAWNDKMVEEMRNFPNGKHDDQVDALSLAFDQLTDNTLGLLDFYAQLGAEKAAMLAASKPQEPPPAPPKGPFPWE
jgi:predicted phage terminase large subunit-like protein